MTCLYTKGDSVTWEGMKFDRIFVEDSEIESYLKKGYVKHPLELEKKEKVKKDELDKKTAN